MDVPKDAKTQNHCLLVGVAAVEFGGPLCWTCSREHVPQSNVFVPPCKLHSCDADQQAMILGLGIFENIHQTSTASHHPRSSSTYTTQKRPFCPQCRPRASSLRIDRCGKVRKPTWPFPIASDALRHHPRAIHSSLPPPVANILLY